MSANPVEIGRIVESLEVVYTAYCPRCVSQEDSNEHENAFAKKLFEKGWRVANDGSDELLCS